jgi:hypothetical protein
MEKQEHSQLEFFSETQGKVGLTQPRPRMDILGSMRSHEKKILLTISFLIVGIVSFSLGVEKGKRVSSLAVPKSTALSIARKEPAPKAEPAQPAAALKQAPAVTQPTDNLQAYTIQIACYLNRNSAETEAMAFKKRGLNALILSKGKYQVLCVGNFPSRESAQMLLSELRKQKRYQDCTIRRL